MSSLPHPPLVWPRPVDGVARFEHAAMATRYEIFVAGEDPGYARQAADAAFEECDRLYRELSRLVPSSDIAQVNACQPGWSVCVGAAALELLELAQRLQAQTQGAFDVTVGALMDGESGPVGIELLEIDRSRREVTRRKAGLKIDLGGLGRGYALDQMARVLADWGIGSALLHAAQSSIRCTGAMPDGGPWRVRLRNPQRQESVIGEVSLVPGRALSGSGLLAEGQHIQDPLTRQPVTGKLAAWALAPSAVLSDALSTAFMVMPWERTQIYCREHPEVSALMLTGEAGRPLVSLAGAFAGLDVGQ